MSTSAKDGVALLHTVSGGTSYGTTLPDQGDYDYTEVTVMPQAFYLGLEGTSEVASKQEFGEAAGKVTDTTYHEVTKFFRLVANGNPAVFPFLFANDPNRAGARADRVWREMVLGNKELFLSKAPYHAFRGMAVLELKRFQASVEMDLGEKVAWKSAMHSVRLLRMLCEYLETGSMRVCRTGYDHEYLWQVRQGLVAPKYVNNEVERLWNKAEGLLVSCGLPERCDMEALSGLLVDVKLAFWARFA